MKTKLFILFLIFQIQSFASTIGVGLRSENIIVWNFWENNNGILKQYLCLYNKTEGEIKVEINLKRYKSTGDTFEEVKTDKVFYNLNLKAGQLEKVEYPSKSTKLDFMRFIETGKYIGLLNINSEKPDPSFINDKYKYYSNAGINSGFSSFYWVRFESIYDANTSIGITPNFKYSDYFFLKIINKNKDDGEPYWGKLNALHKTDNSIIKIDQSNKIYTLQLQRKFGLEKLALFTIIIESAGGSAENARMPIFKVN